MSSPSLRLVPSFRPLAWTTLNLIELDFVWLSVYHFELLINLAATVVPRSQIRNGRKILKLDKIYHQAVLILLNMMIATDEPMI